MMVLRVVNVCLSASVLWRLCVHFPPARTQNDYFQLLILVSHFCHFLLRWLQFFLFSRAHHSLSVHLLNMFCSCSICIARFFNAPKVFIIRLSIHPTGCVAQFGRRLRDWLTDGFFNY